MKIQKIFAGISACAVMVVSMAVMAVSAAEPLLKRSSNDGSDVSSIYKVDFTDYDVAEIDGVVADISVSSYFVNGTIGGNYGGNWSNEGELKVTGSTTGSWKKTGLKGTFQNPPAMEIQFWYVGNLNGAEGIATLDKVTFLDVDGNVLSKKSEATTTAATTPEKVQNTFSKISEINTGVLKVSGDAGNFEFAKNTDTSTVEKTAALVLMDSDGNSYRSDNVKIVDNKFEIAMDLTKLDKNPNADIASVSLMIASAEARGTATINVASADIIVGGMSYSITDLVGAKNLTYLSIEEAKEAYLKKEYDALSESDKATFDAIAQSMSAYYSGAVVVNAPIAVLDGVAVTETTTVTTTAATTSAATTTTTTTTTTAATAKKTPSTGENGNGIALAVTALMVAAGLGVAFRKKSEK